MRAGEDRVRGAEQTSCRQRPEIAAVEAVARRIDEEEFAAADDPATGPDGERAVRPIARQRAGDRHAVHRDEDAGTADERTGKARDPLQQRHAARQISALRKECPERGPAGDVAWWRESARAGER